MNHRMRFLLMMCLLALGAGAVLASGFAVNEQGTRAMGQAMAFAARADDPSAIYFNPAGITQLEGTQFYFGGTLIKQSSGWENQGATIESDDKMEFPPHIYYTQQLNDSWFVGFGVFVPFGLSKQWPDTFPGKYVNHKTELKNIYFNPNVAVKLSDAISFAIGIDLIWTHAKLNRYLYLQDLSDQIYGGYPLDDGYFHADVKGNDIGWNTAFHFKLNEDWSAGISYRSRATIDLDGTLDLTTPETGVPAIDGSLATLFPSQDVRTRLSLPDNWFFGIGGNVTKNYEMEVDFQYVQWSVYKNLPFWFTQQTPVLQDQENLKLWNNAWAIRWGHEYHLNENMDLRAGFYYDTTPIPDETLDSFLPGNDRISFQGGFGWHNERWVFDVAYMYFRLFDRDISSSLHEGIIPSSGTYSGSAHLFGISLGVRF